jgi:hypothetical protein
MIKAVSDVPSAQAAVDAAQLAVDAATTADKYATQYSDFVTHIVTTPIQQSGMGGMGMGGGMGAMGGMAASTSIGRGGLMPTIIRHDIARAKALTVATRAADVNAALQNTTNYYNLALAATDKYNL